MTTPLHIVIWKEGKHYVSQCLNVDVSSFGETREEAVKNLNEALELYFEDGHHTANGIIEEPEIMSMPFEHA